MTPMNRCSVVQIALYDVESTISTTWKCMAVTKKITRSTDHDPTFANIRLCVGVFGRRSRDDRLSPRAMRRLRSWLM